MPIRGKILNCLKVDYDRIFKSDIITDLIKILGCGVQVDTGKTKSKKKDINAFNIDNLRWNKVIICTDADVDGFHIRTMLLTMIYRLTPELIKAGKVYIAESPLYEITTKDKVYFAYTEAEKEKYKDLRQQLSDGIASLKEARDGLNQIDSGIRQLEELKAQLENIKKGNIPISVLLDAYPDLREPVQAIGLPECDLCTYCWNGKE